MEDLVEAIEEGKIVQVTESYARSEGLTIIRRPKIREIHEKLWHQNPGFSQIRTDQRRPFKEYLEYPQHWKKSQVTKELVDNFHWQVRVERKKKNLTRKQLAKLINESEENIKMLEAGFLPSNDFILINKIQQTLGINLRKDQKDFTQSIGDMMKKTTIAEKGGWISRKDIKEKKHPPQTQGDNFSGSDIEILDEEI